MKPKSPCVFAAMQAVGIAILVGGCGGNGPVMPDAAGAAEVTPTEAGAAPDTFFETGVNEDGSHDAAAPAGETPPQGRAAMEAWLAAGHYKSWACEAAIMPARPHGAHGRTRICSNALASRHGAGPYPVGAAAVKELYDGGTKLVGYAVGRKLTDGTTGAAWYWYERLGSTIYADGVNTSLCSSCHEMAGQRGGKDFVYVQVKETTMANP